MRLEFDAVDPAIARIILIEAGPSILPAFPEDLRESARRALLRLGIDVRVGKAVTKVEEGAVWLGDERIEAHTILWAAGVAAAPLSRDLGPGLDRAGRVIVEPDLSVPGHPGVFVAGDLATFTHQTGKPLPGVAQVAKQAGRHAAANVARLIAGGKTTPFRYIDPGNMATIGRNAAIADFGFLRVSGYLGLVDLALRAHPVPDWLPESALGDAAMGCGVSHLSAQRPPHHAQPAGIGHRLRRHRFTVHDYPDRQGRLCAKGSQMLKPLLIGCALV